MKLTESSRAVILLRKKFRTGQIANSDNTKAIWESDPIFMAHKLANFRSKFNKIKPEQKRTKLDEIFPRCTIEDEPSKKRKLSNLEEKEENSTAHVYAEETSGLHTLQPIHLVFERVEPGTTAKRLTVAILLPSAVSSGNVSIRVSEDGCALELAIMWPKPLSDLKMLHRKWLLSKKTDKIDLYHPKLIGFEHHLKSHRLRSSDKVKSMARINLPFQDQTRISEKFNLAWAGSSAKVVYVEWRGQEEIYGVSKDNESFEIF